MGCGHPSQANGPSQARRSTCHSRGREREQPPRGPQCGRGDTHALDRAGEPAGASRAVTGASDTGCEPPATLPPSCLGGTLATVTQLLTRQDPQAPTRGNDAWPGRQRGEGTEAAAPHLRPLPGNLALRAPRSLCGAATGQADQTLQGPELPSADAPLLSSGCGVPLPTPHAPVPKPPTQQRAIHTAKASDILATPRTRA